uniref:Uncharacterized protein n=1 Tax=Molossus molossus TaxID=27622 RepID=A0A7J8FRU5_MOLMO|nr:hypothetical protein HJG59_008312 [Molossus molossus]
MFSTVLAVALCFILGRPCRLFICLATLSGLLCTIPHTVRLAGHCVPHTVRLAGHCVYTSRTWRHRNSRNTILSNPQFTRKLLEETYLKILVILVLLKFIKQAWCRALLDGALLMLQAYLQSH